MKAVYTLLPRGQVSALSSAIHTPLKPPITRESSVILVGRMGGGQSSAITKILYPSRPMVTGIRTLLCERRLCEQGSERWAALMFTTNVSFCL